VLCVMYIVTFVNLSEPKPSKRARRRSASADRRVSASQADGFAIQPDRYPSLLILNTH